jgi:hypothetical protein
LDKYCSWSGQSINASKSSIRSNKNTNPAISDAITNILPYPSNPSKSLYLGLPIFLGNSRKIALQGIIDKVLEQNRRLESQNSITSSQIGFD